MAWYRNHYRCGDCGTDWDDEWSCCCDDECPTCGSGDWSPVSSEDLTFILETEGNHIVIYESPMAADDSPEYVITAIAPTDGAARSYVKWRMASYWEATP